MSDFVENIKHRGNGTAPFQTTGAISVKTPASIDIPNALKSNAETGSNGVGNYDILKIISKKRNSS